MNRRSYCEIILAGILWGTSGVFVGWLIPYGFSSLSLTAFRGIVAFIFLLVYCLIREHSAFRIRKEHCLLFLGIGITQFATATCYFLCMQMTSVATAVVLMYTSPVYVMLFSVLFWKESFSLIKGLAVGGMLLGSALVSGLIGSAVFHGWGVVIGILSGVTYGLYSLLTKTALKNGYSPLSPVLYGSLVMGVLNLPMINIDITINAITKTPLVVLLLLLGLGVVTFVFPFFLYAKGLQRLSAGTAATLSIVEPMAATLFSVIVFRLSLDSLELIGIILILLSVVLLSGSDKMRCDDKKDNDSAI